MLPVDDGLPVRRRRVGVRRATAHLPALLVLVVVAVIAPGASAARYWCRTDPLFTIDGRTADVFVSIPPEALLQITGPTQVVLTVPGNVDARLVLAGVGFGYGEEVTIETSPYLRVTSRGIELWIDVLVPASGVPSPVLVEFAPRIAGLIAPTSSYGEANQWVRLSTTM